MVRNPHLSIFRQILSLLSANLRGMRKKYPIEITPEIQELIDQGLLTPASEQFDPSKVVSIPWVGEGTASEAFERFRDENWPLEVQQMIEDGKLLPPQKWNLPFSSLDGEKLSDEEMQEALDEIREDLI
jgi:hypothetical protein